MSATIIAAIDLSPPSERVVEHAAQLARAFQGRLYIIHVAAPDPEFVGLEVGPAHVRDQRAAELREEHARLHQMAASLRAQGVDAEALLVQGPTVETLLQEVVRLNAQHLVTGSHGRTGLMSVLMGSVCAQLLREVKVPITIIPMAR
ncbi:MAG: universal stress protein [Flavobacteriales bacterium]|nr:universal stress protein [Flavobacteriales bacterium]